jgi:hypothetical protein
MVSVPVLTCDPGFGATPKSTVPLPCPPGCDVIVTQSADELAVQTHEPALAVTATVPPPPVAGTDTFVGAIEYVHGAGAA